MNTITRAAIKADSQIPADRKAGALAYLSGQAEVLLPKLLVSASEAGRVMSASRQSIWRWTRDDILSAVVIGGMKRYRMSDLQQLAQTGAKGRTPSKGDGR